MLRNPIQVFKCQNTVQTLGLLEALKQDAGTLSSAWKCWGLLFTHCNWKVKGRSLLFCSSNIPSSRLPWSCCVGLAEILLCQTSHAGSSSSGLSSSATFSEKPSLTTQAQFPPPLPLQPIAWYYWLHFTL